MLHDCDKNDCNGSFFASISSFQWMWHEDNARHSVAMKSMKMILKCKVFSYLLFFTCLLARYISHTMISHDKAKVVANTLTFDNISDTVSMFARNLSTFTTITTREVELHTSLHTIYVTYCTVYSMLIHASESVTIYCKLAWTVTQTRTRTHSAVYCTRTVLFRNIPNECQATVPWFNKIVVFSLFIYLYQWWMMQHRFIPTIEFVSFYKVFLGCYVYH